MTTTAAHRQRRFLLSLLTLLTLVGAIGLGPTIDASASTHPAAQTRVRAIDYPAPVSVAAVDLGSSTPVEVSRVRLRQLVSATGVATEDGAATQLHHSDPKFMGGEPKQPLTELTQSDHQALHQDMNDFLRSESDDFGNHMRPQRGNSGAAIQENFTRGQRLDALARFYSGPGAKYADAAADFFAQHPELGP